MPEANAMASYRVNKGTGDLKAVLGSPFGGGTSPVAIAVHPSGKFVYTANQGGGDISLYTVNSNTGALTEVLPRAPAGLNPTSLVLSSAGDLLFVANQTSNTISVFTVSSSNGALTEAAGSPFPTGSRPVALALSSSGKFLYVAGSKSTAWCSATPSRRGRAVCSRFRDRRLRWAMGRVRWWSLLQNIFSM